MVVRGDHKLELRLLEPLPIYPALLTDGSTAIARGRRAPEATRSWARGPFRLARREPDRVVLERNAALLAGPVCRGWTRVEFRAGAARLRRSRRASARARSTSPGTSLPEDLEEILRDPRFRHGLVEAPKKNTYFVLFNCRSGPRAAATPRCAARSRGVVRTQRPRLAHARAASPQPAACLIPPGHARPRPGPPQPRPRRARRPASCCAAAGVGDDRSACGPPSTRCSRTATAPLLKPLFARLGGAGRGGRGRDLRHGRVPGRRVERATASTC